MAFLRLVACTLIACFVSSASCFAPPSGALYASQTQQRAATSAVSMMAKAPTKPMRVNERNRQYNKQYKSEMRTRIKRVLEATEEGDYSVAVPQLSKAFKIIDKNVKRGIIHKNTAARKKSQLHLKVKKLEGAPPAAAAAEPEPAPA